MNLSLMLQLFHPSVVKNLPQLVDRKGGSSVATFDVRRSVTKTFRNPICQAVSRNCNRTYVDHGMSYIC